MSRSLRLYLADILSSISKIEIYAGDLNYEELCEDECTLDAIIHNLQIIGETAKQSPNELRENIIKLSGKELPA